MKDFVPVKRGDFETFAEYEQAVWNEIAKIWIRSFKDDPEWLLQKLANHEFVQLYSFNKMYKWLVSLGELQRVEDLDEETKMQLWKHAKYICPFASAQTGTDICRAIWLLNNM